MFVPDHVPTAKVTSVQNLGGKIHKVTFDEWWEIVKAHRCDNMVGKFIHPVSDHTVIAGNNNFT